MNVLATPRMRLAMEADIVVDRRRVRAIAALRKFDGYATAAITPAASELARNVSVHAGHGEATLDDGGAGLVVRVRVESGEKLGRGQQAVIVGYDDERHEYTVAPMDLADEDDDPKEAGRRAR